MKENYSNKVSNEQCKKEFLSYLSEVGTRREGMDKLIHHLTEKTDFFEAPAHLTGMESREGGLVRHSMNVMRRLLHEVGSENVMETGVATTSDELLDTCIIISLLSGIWKANYFLKVGDNLQNTEGKAFEGPEYVVRPPEERLCYGRDDDHGDEAVYMISGFIRLTRQEAMIIRSQEWSISSREAKRLFRKYPLALSYHIAVLKASFFDEREGAS